MTARIVQRLAKMGNPPTASRNREASPIPADRVIANNWIRFLRIRMDWSWTTMKKQKVTKRIFIRVITTGVLLFAGLHVLTRGFRSSDELMQHLDLSMVRSPDSTGSSENASKHKVSRITGDENRSDLIRSFHGLRKRGLPNDQMRLERQRLITAIATNFGFETAYSLIDNELGKGAEKEFLIASIFMALRESMNSSLMRIESLSQEERSFAIAGLYDRIKYQDLRDDDIAELISNKLVISDPGSLSMAMLTDIANTGDPGFALLVIKRWDRVVEEHETEGGTGLVVSLVNGVSRIYPFEAWKFVSESGWLDKSSSGDGPEVEPVIQSIVRQMTTSDPSSSMNMLSQIGDIGKDYLMSEIQTWMKLSETTAKTWISENKSSLSTLQLESICAGEASYYASSQQFEEAWKAVRTVSDENLGKQIAGQIWKAERDALRLEVGKDPAATVQAIVSGQSKYTDNWLEEAMGTWVAKDFDQAQDWYQQSWKTMPAAKSQYVAAAFASQAVKQGDVATASQWVVYIQDSKTRQRIQDEINKAAANAGN